MMSEYERKSFFIEEVSPDRNWLVVFEDDGETGYIYFCSYDNDSHGFQIQDHLRVYNQISPTIFECEKVNIVWSDDSKKVCLIVDDECWGMIDLDTRRKLFAPREGNSIRTIDRRMWDMGLNNNEGEELRIFY